MTVSSKHVIALAGGVGGAKLAYGLFHLLGNALTVVVNTGDDFEHLGLHISPDLDTVMYTLAGLANRTQGWGLENETWSFMDQLARLGGPSWFRLGDRDLATHLFRTTRLRAGASLTSITEELCKALGTSACIVPMSDEAVRTIIVSGGRRIAFQEYFVRLKCEPTVEDIVFEGAEHARLNPAIASLPKRKDLGAAIICPSNHYLSVDPILAIPEARAWLRSLSVAIIAVSPIIAGAALKGPAAKIMSERGFPVTAATVASHYRGLIDGIVIDVTDRALADEIAAMGIATCVTRTVMQSDQDRIQLAAECIAFARRLAAAGAYSPS